jgi:hypothetical protein
MIRGSRSEQRPEERQPDVAVLPLEHEVLHAAGPGSAAGHVPPPAPKGEDRLPVFWRIFGSTVLSIAALIAVTLYQQITANIHELRGDQNRLSQDYGDLVKKDDFNTRITALSHNLKELQAASTTATDLWRERAALLERQLKAEEEERKQMAREYTHEVQRLCERLAALEGRQNAAPMSVPPNRPRQGGY